MQKMYVLVFAMGVCMANYSLDMHKNSEPHYPSYVGSNHYGLCLRATTDLKKGALVATADFEKTEKGIIKGASYFVYEGMDDDIYHLPRLGLRHINIPVNCTFAKVYKFNGRLLRTIQRPEKDCTHLLDPNAPKPRPVSYTYH